MKTATALTGIACALVALPWWSGGVAVAGFEQTDAAIAEGTQGLLLSSHTVERGILRSFATHELRRAPDAESGTTDPSIRLHHTIFHGPLPVGELLHGRLPRGLARAIVETEVWLPAVDPDRVFATVTTHVALNGLTQVEFEAPSCECKGPILRWSGATGSLVAEDGELGRVAGFAEMSFLEMGHIRIEDVQLDFDGETTTAPDIGIGTSTFRIGRVRLTTPEGEIELTELAASQHSEVDAEGRFSTTLRTDLSTVQTPEARYGPGAFQMALRNLDPLALSEYQAFSDADSVDAEQAKQIALEQLTALLSRSPELEIMELSFSSPHGRLVGTAHARIDGDSPALAMGAAGAMSALTAEADLQIPVRILHAGIDAPLAERLARPASAGATIEAARLRTEWIQELLSAGYLRLTGEGYRVRIEFSGGQVRLNGIPIDPKHLTPTQGT